MLLYSSETPFYNVLPLDLKSKFSSIAAKGEWTPQEAFQHLVPQHLQDNPDEVRAWMDGIDITTTEWVNDRGIANGHYEEVEWQIPDRDVSRIEAGGEYSAENTIMEDMSVNRSRQAADMTGTEYETAVDMNNIDAKLIEDHFVGDAEVLTEAIPLPTVIEGGPVAEMGGSFIGDIGEAVMEGLLPAIAAVKAGQYVSDKCDTTKDKVGYGLLSAGGAAWFMTTPIGIVCAAGYGGYKLTQLAFKTISRFA